MYVYVYMWVVFFYEREIEKYSNNSILYIKRKPLFTLTKNKLYDLHTLISGGDHVVLTLYRSFRLVKYPYTKQFTWSPQGIPPFTCSCYNINVRWTSMGDTNLQGSWHHSLWNTESTMNYDTNLNNWVNDLTFINWWLPCSLSIAGNDFPAHWLLQEMIPLLIECCRKWFHCSLSVAESDLPAHWVLQEMISLVNDCCRKWCLCSLSVAGNDFPAHWLLQEMISLFTEYCRKWFPCSLSVAGNDFPAYWLLPEIMSLYIEFCRKWFPCLQSVAGHDVGL